MIFSMFRNDIKSGSQDVFEGGERFFHKRENATIKEANGPRVNSNISDIRSKKDLQYSTKLGHDQNI